MSWAIWLTGRPGSGASTLARAAAARLAERGTPVTVLELDEIRPVLTPQPAHTEDERDTVDRALVFMARALAEAGVPVVVDATGPRRAWRDLARASISRFAEVQLECPREVAEARRRPDAAGPRVEVPYERAASPDLVVDTSMEDVATAAARVAALAGELEPRRLPPRTGEGAVIWLTGPPGSGKTTLASRLAEGLAAEGVAVTVLEWVTLRALVLGGGTGRATADEIGHRALVYTAKLLADQGLTVVVDATAPRRAWRTLARELTGVFAEVQLVCPPEVCLARERAVRWGLQPCPHGGGGTLDVAVEYEYSLSPDLLLDTATRSEWAAGEDLLRLARRLLRRRVAG